MENFNLLENKKFIEWCYKGITEWTILDKDNKSTQIIKEKSKKIEKEWGNFLIGGKGNGQWTTLLGESAVKELLTKLGYKNVRNTKKVKSTTSEKTYKLDLECDDFVYEVKTSNWTISGTAGEKVLGSPLKYSEVPKLYGKPLKIICLGYQEWELKNNYGCGNIIHPEKRGTEELKKILILLKKLNIEYVGFTELLEKYKKVN